MIYVFDDGKFIRKGKTACIQDYRKLMEDVSMDAYTYWENSFMNKWSKPYETGGDNITDSNQVPKIYRALLLLHKE